MKIKLLALFILLATAGVQAERTSLPDKAVTITHVAELHKRFFRSSDAVKSFLKETRLLEKLSEKRIHLLDLSMRLSMAYIEYHTKHPDLDDVTRGVIRDSYAEVVRNILQESPKEAEILIAHDHDAKEELGLHVVKVWIEGQGEVAMVVGRTSTLKDGDHITLAQQSAAE